MGQNKSLSKILLVDDEISILDSLERLLRDRFQIFKSTRPDEALHILKDHGDCAVILSDYRMPQMDGVSFLKQTRILAPFAVRSILSGQVQAPELVEAINEAEIHRLILKPWDNEYLKIQMLESLVVHQTLKRCEELHQLSITDPVTQLTNHRYFQETLKKEIERAKTTNHPLSVIMIDVDYFKSFNDRYGHPEGDRLLSNIANTMTQIFPKASRYGGEEFAIVLPEKKPEEAAQMAEQLRSKLENQPFAGPFGRPAFITISLGIAGYPKHGQTPNEVLSAADRALYQAKRQGRNQTVVA